MDQVLVGTIFVVSQGAAGPVQPWLWNVVAGVTSSYSRICEQQAVKESWSSHQVATSIEVRLDFRSIMRLKAQHLG
jgi:hypothetical protein